MTDKLHKQLDERFGSLGATRRVVEGDPPPADPPKPGYVWSPFERFWVESDDQFRKRLREGSDTQ